MLKQSSENEECTIFVRDQEIYTVRDEPVNVGDFSIKGYLKCSCRSISSTCGHFLTNSYCRANQE